MAFKRTFLATPGFKVSKVSKSGLWAEPPKNVTNITSNIKYILVSPFRQSGARTKKNRIACALHQKYVPYVSYVLDVPHMSENVGQGKKLQLEGFFQRWHISEKPWDARGYWIAKG